MHRFSVPEIQIGKLSCCNTHGDYFISQLICGERKINAVIDWTSACIHPAVWEIIRSFVYASPDCADGMLDANKFISYVEQYLRYSKLNLYDIEMMPYVFYYQISVCDYYSQYYQSNADNREIYLRQAILSTKMMKWFDENIVELSGLLVQQFKGLAQ
jgi:thiamine kinase-like enzyme